jgi:hypothetical protein
MKKLTVLLGVVSTLANAQISYVPPKGFVPDQTTAVLIAEAILTPIYGADEISRQRPFNATEINSQWLVVGSIKENQVGGVASIVIDKQSGKIIRVTHSR